MTWLRLTVWAEVGTAVLILFVSATATIVSVNHLDSTIGAAQHEVLESAETTIPVGSFPFGIAYDPVNHFVYVSNYGSGNISVLNTTTDRAVEWIPVPFGFESLVADSATGVVYGADAASSAYAISPAIPSVVTRISLTGAGCPNGCIPDARAYDPANGDIYVTDIATNYVSIINGTTAVGWVGVGLYPNGAAYDAENGDIYVVNEGSSSLTIINGSTNQVTQFVRPVQPGEGIAYDSSNQDLYVCSNAVERNQSNNITVVNGSSNTILAVIPISSACQGAIYDSFNGYVYITDRSAIGGQDLANVTIVDPDTNRIASIVPVQAGPCDITFDSANDNVYVADSGTNNVSILPQITRLAVHETGLPRGTNWSATVGGTTQSSTTPTIYFPETSGTLNFSIGHAANLTANPSSGTIQVSGGEQWLNVSFSKGGGTGILGLPDETGYYVIVGIVAVAAILIAAVVILSRATKRRGAAGPPPQAPPSV